MHVSRVKLPLNLCDSLSVIITAAPHALGTLLTPTGTTIRVRVPTD